MPYIKKIREQTPEMKQLEVLTNEVVEIKKTLKRSFNELRQNSLIFRTIDAKRRKLNECEGLNLTYSTQRNEKRKFDEIDETILVKPSLINNKKIKHITENDKFSTHTDNKYMESITDIKINNLIKKIKCYVQKLQTIIEEDEKDDA